MAAFIDWFFSITSPKHWARRQSTATRIPCDDHVDDELHSAYAPFARNDAYGVAGWHGPSHTLWDYLRIVRRTVCLTISLGCFVTTLTVGTLLLPPERARALIRRTNAWHAANLLYSLGFAPLEVVVVQENGSVTVDDPRSVTTTTPVLVCNHVSYLDMLVLCIPRFFPSFVAKAPIQDMPVWGTLARVMNCTFVSHGSSRHKGGAVDAIVAKIQEQQSQPSEAQPILIFPEGTTTNGSYLLPFRNGAFVANVPVQPILLQYNDDIPSSAHNGKHRFHPSWESIGVTTHLWRLLAQSPRHRCRMTMLPPMTPQGDGEDPAAFGERVRQVMAQAGNLQLSPLVYRDKAAYHTKLRELGYS